MLPAVLVLQSPQAEDRFIWRILCVCLESSACTAPHGRAGGLQNQRLPQSKPPSPHPGGGEPSRAPQASSQLCHDSAGDTGGTLGQKPQEEPQCSQCSHCCPGYWDWRPPTPAHSCCPCLGSLPCLREQEIRVQAQDYAHMKKKRKNNHPRVQGWEMWAGSLGMVTFSSSTDHSSSRMGGSGSLRHTAQPSA